MALAGDHIQILVAGYDLTGDLNRVSIDDTRKMLPVGVFGDTVEKFMPGQQMAKVMHQGFLNADANRSHAVLDEIDAQGVVAVLVGQNADPLAGDPIYHLMTRQERYQVSAKVGQVIPFKASFVNNGARAGWGTIIAPLTTIADSTTGSAVDNDSASTDGAAFLQILQTTASDTYSTLIEGSADGATGWTTVASFTLDGSQIGSERVEITGAIPQYLRYRATRTGSAGDALQLAVSLVRF
ncbi:MAG: hypothetical protein AAF846_01060 [Chloroflexota bacterium]